MPRCVCVYVCVCCLLLFSAAVVGGSLLDTLDFYNLNGLPGSSGRDPSRCFIRHLFKGFCDLRLGNHNPGHWEEAGIYIDLVGIPWPRWPQRVF